MCIRDRTNVITAASNPTLNEIEHRLGQTCQGDDGKTYVFARANGTIAANTAVCTISPTTFLATNIGGAYTSPAAGMVINDYAWFGKSNV